MAVKQKLKTINIHERHFDKLSSIVRLRNLGTIKNAVETMIEEEASRLVVPTTMRRVNTGLDKAIAMLKK